MPFRETASLKYFFFNTFSHPELIQGIFTRHGGVSPSPWTSLNLGGTVGDEREHVVENRQRIFDACGRAVESIYDPWQVHGTEVICVAAPRPLNSAHLKADVILTNQIDVTLFMRFADCVPIMLYDPVMHVIGLVHAGWRGTVAGAAAAAVQSMVSHYGCAVKDIQAGIGPSICVEHYQVGDDVISAAREQYGSVDAEKVFWKNKGAYHFDLWRANQLVLEKSGVEHIEQSGLCTFCDHHDWYSHRAEQGKTGRFGAILGMKNPGAENQDELNQHNPAEY